MQVPEHTWGVDIKIYLDDYANWTNAELQRQIATREPRYIYTIDAWIRQRSYTRWALEALDASLVSSACLHLLFLPMMGGLVISDQHCAWPNVVPVLSRKHAAKIWQCGRYSVLDLGSPGLCWMHFCSRLEYLYKVQSQQVTCAPDVL